MKLSIAKEVMKTNVKAQVEGKEVQPIVFSSSPGLGKTRTIEAIAKELNYAFLNVSIPTITSEELSGLPDFADAPDMVEYSLTKSSMAKSTEWTVCNLIADANRLAREYSGCLLLLDDLHELSLSTSPYMYSLLEERALGQYKLDSRVGIACAMNNSDAANFSGLASPIKDRCSILPVEFDFDDWYNSHGKYLNYLIASFIKLHSQYIQEDESTGIEQFLTPRSCTYFGSELDLYSPEFIAANAKDLAEMKMSKTAAIAFTKHVEYLNKIDFSSIVKSRDLVDLSIMKPIDAILYAYIINYIETKADANYLCDLIETNINEASFLGFLTGELYTKYLLREAGKPITEGISLIIDAIIAPDSTDIQIKSRDKIYEYMIEFM